MLETTGQVIRNLYAHVEPTVALMHHPMEWLHADEMYTRGDREATWDYLATCCDLLLTGHTHGKTAKKANYLQGRAYHYIGGAAYAGISYFNSFRLLRVDGAKITTKTYEFNPMSVGERWRPTLEEECEIGKNRPPAPVSGSSSAPSAVYAVISPVVYAAEMAVANGAPRTATEFDPTTTHQKKDRTIDEARPTGENHPPAPASASTSAAGQTAVQVAENISPRSPADSPEAGEIMESSKEHLRRSYLQWTVECHERLEFRGVQHARGGVVSVELKRVYLALQADSTNPLERAAARQALLDELLQAVEQGKIAEEASDDAIWRFVAGAPTMPSLESRDRLNQLDDKLKEILNLGEAYFRESQLVVLGDPGSGKTTLARWLSLVCAQAALQGKPHLVVPLSHVDPSVSQDELTISLGLVRIPILIRVADYADARRTQADRPGLLEFLGKQGWFGKMPTWDGDGAMRGQRIDAIQLNQYLVEVVRSGQALIVLDGLDEIPASDLRDEIVEEVDAFANQHVRTRQARAVSASIDGHPVITVSNLTASSPGNRLIITSRIAGYHVAALKGNLAHVTIEPMVPAATDRFILNWMQAVHAETAGPSADPRAVKAAADDEAQKLILKLKEPRQRGGRELASNPLLCGILATLFRRERGELPQERVELYRQAVDILLDIWIHRWMSRGRAEQDLLRKRWELLDVLEPLAEHIHRNEPTGLISEGALAKLALQFLAESRGLAPALPSAALRADVDDLIRVIREDVGLLAARGEGVYGFLHLTFQEYFAARFLVRDLKRSGERVRRHFSDARWREAIKLSFGHLSIADPEHFKALLLELLGAKSELRDLLPQAALLVIGAIPDIRDLDSEVVELLAETLINSYAIRELSDRLPRRRELLEGGLRRLIDSGFGKQVERSLVRSLAASCIEPALAAAAAEIIGTLDYHSGRLTEALLAALPNDSLAVRCPIHRALRLSVSPRYGEEIPRVSPSSNLLPFRHALLLKPELAEYIRSDFDWLRVAIALYGGLGEYEVARGLRTYHQMACYLQQEDVSRSHYELAYRDEWGGNDGDVVYNMAVFLDTKGGTLTKRGKQPLIFNPLQICQDSGWTDRILAALEGSHSVEQFLKAAREPEAPSSRIARKELALVELAIGKRSQLTQASEADYTGEGVRTLARGNVSDAVARTGPQLIAALAVLKGKMDANEWWSVLEAALTTLLCHGGEPLGAKILTLKTSADVHENSRLLSEALYHFARGWGDDAVYNSTVFADTAKCTPSEFLGAFSLLPIAAHSAWTLYYSEWPLVVLSPAAIREGELPPSIVANMEMMPVPLGFMRFWTLQVLEPIIDADPDLLPEILAFGLGNVGERGVRNDVFSTFAPELLEHQQPAEDIFERIQSISNPYHRARASLRLSIHSPARRGTLLADTARLAGEIPDAVHAAQVFEWLAGLTPDPNRGKYWEFARAKVAEIGDPDERARAWARLGVLAKPQDTIACFEKALEVCGAIKDEFQRGTTIRLLRRVFGELREMEVGFQKLTSAFQNPIFQARASEDWGGVFQNVDPSLFSQSDFRHLWAVLFVAAQAGRDFVAGQITTERLWVQLANEPTQETADLLQERAQSDLLRCSTLVTHCLDRLLLADQHALV